MVEHNYQYGGVTFSVLAPAGLKETPESARFRTGKDVTPDYIYELRAVENGDRKWSPGPLPQKREGNRISLDIDEEVLKNLSVPGLFSGAYTGWLLPEMGKFILHCSYVLYQGQAILFCAPSGTGKSTQADFWHQHRGSVTVNEDRAIIGKKDGVFHAWGCWAKGKGTACENETAPIRAIVLLGQGPENRTRSVGAVEAFCKMIPQCTYNENDPRQCRRITALAAELIGAVPVIGYDCVNDPSSVADLEKCL